MSSGLIEASTELPAMRLDNKLKLLLLISVDIILLGVLFFLLSYAGIVRLPEPELIALIPIVWTSVFLLTISSTFFERSSLIQRVGAHIKLVFISCTVIGYALFWMGGERVDSTFITLGPLGLLLLGWPRVRLQQLILEQIPTSETDKLLIVGNGKVGAALTNYLSTTQSQGEVIGIVDNKTDHPPTANWLGKIEDIEEVYQTNPFQRILITTEHQKPEHVEALLAFSEKHAVRTSLVLDFPSISKRNFELRDLGGIAVVDFREVPLKETMAKFWKRLFDVAFSLMALIMLAPLFFLIALAIKAETRGPIFYRPVRVGKEGSRIRIFKFRSMIHQLNPDLETVSTQKNDHRVTKVGKLLRRFSLDELPQFINVLEGSMSVVGPRPHRLDLDKTFEEAMPSYPVRRFIKPGITGWAQINGWRGLTKNKLDLKARALHDLWYVEHWSLGLDLIIILLTVFGKKSHQNAF